MRAIATVQKQQSAMIAALLAVMLIGARLLASSKPEQSVLYILGGVAAILALMSAEIAIHFLIIAMLLSPEIAVGGPTYGAVLARPVTLRIDDFLLLIICATWFIRSVLYKEINILKHTPLNGAIYLYIFAALFSTMLGVMHGNVDPKTGGLFVLKYIEYFLIYWMVVNTVQDEGQLRRFLLVMLLVALTVSVIAILQIPQGVRVSAPFEGAHGEPNTLGGYLLFVISILMAFVIVDTKYRWPAAILCSVLLLAFTYTLSRASYVSLIPAVLILPILTRRYMLMMGMLIFGLLIAMFAKNVLPQKVYERMSFTFSQRPLGSEQQVQIFGGAHLDTSTSARIVAVQVAVDAFFQSPLFGWGVTGWAFLDSQYFRTLSETGLFGFFSLAFLLFRIVQLGLRSMNIMRKRDPVYFAMAAGFLAGTCGLMTHALGSNTFIIVRIMEPFWLMCALVYLVPLVTVPTEELRAR